MVRRNSGHAQPTAGTHWNVPSVQIADRACGFIEDHAKNQSAKPFFMYVAFNAPHWPVTAKPEDGAHYTGKYAMGWDELRTQRFARQKRRGCVACLITALNI
mgnify:CR=1 FL=1